MDSLLSPPNDQRHKKDVAPMMPGPTAVTARLGGPLQDSEGWFASAAMSPQPVDVSAEESCPAPTVETTPDIAPPQLSPEIQPAQAPSATTFELISQLDELASDLTAKGHASSEESVPAAEENADSSTAPEVAEPSIRVPPRSDFEQRPFATESEPKRRRMIFTLAGVCLAALAGAGIAWQSNFGPTKSTNVDVAAAKTAPADQTSTAKTAPTQSAPAPQAAVAPAVPAPAPELAKQLETMAEELAAVRRSVEQLTAKQEQLAAAQQQLEQLTTKQTQLTAKQEQLAQNLAKLQATEQSVKPKTTPAAQSRAAAVPPPRTSSEPAAQLPSPSRPPSHPVPPLPIPQ
jgi:hypothetical protein